MIILFKGGGCGGGGGGNRSVILGRDYEETFPALFLLLLVVDNQLISCLLTPLQEFFLIFP